MQIHLFTSFTCLLYTKWDYSLRQRDWEYIVYITLANIEMLRLIRNGRSVRITNKIVIGSQSKYKSSDRKPQRFVKLTIPLWPQGLSVPYRIKGHIEIRGVVWTLNIDSISFSLLNMWHLGVENVTCAGKEVYSELLI